LGFSKVNVLKRWRIYWQITSSCQSWQSVRARVCYFGNQFSTYMSFALELLFCRETGSRMFTDAGQQFDIPAATLSQPNSRIGGSVYMQTHVQSSSLMQTLPDPSDSALGTWPYTLFSNPAPGLATWSLVHGPWSLVPGVQKKFLLPETI